jgi:hypothetical protein
LADAVELKLFSGFLFFDTTYDPFKVRGRCTKVIGHPHQVRTLSPEIISVSLKVTTDVTKVIAHPPKVRTVCTKVIFYTLKVRTHWQGIIAGPHKVIAGQTQDRLHRQKVRAHRTKFLKSFSANPHTVLISTTFLLKKKNIF